MNYMLLMLLLTVSVGGFIFFLLRWIQLRSGYRAMSEVERRYTEIRASQDAKQSQANRLPGRWASLKQRYGLQNSIIPAVATIGFGYITISAALRAVGMSEISAIVIALPVGVVIAVIGSRVAASRRIDRFNSQMVTMLDLLTAQIRGGTGVERAFTAILPSLQEPMYTEIDKALKATASGGDLVTAMTDIRERYPSRSLDLFLAALEIDRDEGHSIVPALEQASELMKNAFTLQSEGRAELGSAKWEFYGVFAVVMGLSVQMLFVSQDSAAVWASPLGILILILAFANAGFGVFRFTRIVNKLKKETE